MITYEPFWRTLKKKEISQYCLIKEYKISSCQLGRLRHNRPVSTHTIETLCRILDCRVEDIAQYIPDQKPGEGPDDDL